MTEIDFLPGWYIAARTRREDFAFRGVYLGAVLAAMAVLGGIRFVQTVSAEKAVVNLRSQLDPTTLTAGSEAHSSLMSLRTRWSETDRRRKLLEEAQGGAPVHAILAELSGLMPEAAVMSSVQLIEATRFQPPKPLAPESKTAEAGVNPSGAGRLEIQGWAPSDGQVGHLLSRMGESRAFAEVKLGYSKPVIVEGREAREFKLACRLPAFE